MYRFAYRVALANGIDVDEVLEWDTCKLQEWSAFYEVEPFGNEWLQSAQIVQAMGNIWGRKKGQAAFKIEDFLPVKKQQSFGELKSALLNMVAAQNQKLKESKNGRQTTSNVVRDSTKHKKD